MSGNALFLSVLAVILAIVWALYMNSGNRKIRKTLKWIPMPPGIPLLGHSLQFPDTTKFITVFSEYTKKYGPLFHLKIGLDHFVVISDHQYLERILSSPKLLRKSVNYRFFHNWLGTGLLTSTGSKWRSRRKILTPAFHFSILTEFISVFEEQGKRLLQNLEKTLGNDSIDIFPYVNLFALDVICETAMGVSIDAQYSEDSDYVRSVKTMLKIAIGRTFSAVEGFETIYAFTRTCREEKKALKVLHDKTYSVIESKRKILKDGKRASDNLDEFGRKKRLAFLDILLRSNIDGKPLSNDDIREEVDTFMFEGHDTTTSAISFSLYCLSEAPSNIQATAFEEQKNIYGSDRDRPTTLEDLNNMKYLELVIKEALRLYPTVSAFGRLTEEDYEFEAGKVIPKGVNIIVNAYEAHRDSRVFPDPEKFDPSRWEKTELRNPYSYIPFSAGPRNCIGQKFAMLEVKCTVSKILRSFELLPAPSGYRPILQFDAVLTSQNGIHLKLKNRQWE